MVVARGSAAGPLLRAIAGQLTLRDRVAAVVLVDPLWSASDRAWLAEWFTHPAFEPEVVRPVFYATLLDCDPAAPESWSRWTDQRLPIPPEPPSGRRVIEVVDFGPVVLSALPAEALARALVIWLALSLGS